MRPLKVFDYSPNQIICGGFFHVKPANQNDLAVQRPPNSNYFLIKQAVASLLFWLMGLQLKVHLLSV